MLKLTKAVLVVAFLFLFVSMTAAEEPVSVGKTEWDHGILMFKSDDGDFLTRFDMRGYINGAYFFEDDNYLANGTQVRKARLAIKTQLHKYWRAEWDVDVAEGVVEIKDFFVAFHGFENSHIKFGNFKMPLGLEELTSSRYQTFVERAYPMIAFETDRHIGLEYSRWGNSWNVRAALFGQPWDAEKEGMDDEGTVMEETGNGAGLRLVYAPIHNSETILHTGVAAVFQKPDYSDYRVRFRSEPETKIADAELLSTGRIKHVEDYMKTGLELALVHKNFSVQGEYVQADVFRTEGHENASFNGAYGYLSWFLTGESRPWDSTQGEFGHVIPKSKKTGAWELALRYSTLNLNDDKADVLGGKANNITLGLNWHANSNMIFLLNYTMVDNDKNATDYGTPPDYDFSVLHFMTVFFF